MSKVIPRFYIPKKNFDERRMISLAIVENQNRNLRLVVDSLQAKLTVQRKEEASEKSKSRTVIENYLRGFYAVDLLKLDGKTYSEISPIQRVTPKNFVKISTKSIAEPIKKIEALVEANLEEDLFKERFIQIVAQSSSMLKCYLKDISAFEEKDYKKLTLQKQIEMLKQHCGYSEVSKDGLTSLNIYLQEKRYVDSYLSLFQFLVNNYSELAKENFGLIPIGKIITDLKNRSNFQEDDFKSFLMQLKYTNRITLKTTKSQLARSGNLELVEIHGMRYGFVKLTSSANSEV